MLSDYIWIFCWEMLSEMTAPLSFFKSFQVIQKPGNDNYRYIKLLSLSFFFKPDCTNITISALIIVCEKMSHQMQSLQAAECLQKNKSNRERVIFRVSFFRRKQFPRSWPILRAFLGHCSSLPLTILTSLFWSIHFLACLLRAKQNRFFVL